MNRRNNLMIKMIKVFRMFFTSGLILSIIGSVIVKAPFYVLICLGLTTVLEVWFLGKYIILLKRRS